MSDTTLQCSASGSGPDLVLLHGWGLHSEVWAPVLAGLEARYRVTRIDLPGHGRSGGRLSTLDEAADTLLAAAPADAVWLGWSLGGMIAMSVAARAPARVRQLVLVAANPSFVQRPDWPTAMVPETLAAFAQGLESDFDATLSRFLSLQFRGVKGAAGTLRGLRSELAALPPDPHSLRDGLAILRDADLRCALKDYPGPLAAVLGALDTLVPRSVVDGLYGLRPDLRAVTLEGAGHAPFLTHPGRFLAALDELMA